MYTNNNNRQQVIQRKNKEEEEEKHKFLNEMRERCDVMMGNENRILCLI
jgi:hypothetical protein